MLKALIPCLEKRVTINIGIVALICSVLLLAYEVRHFKDDLVHLNDYIIETSTTYATNVFELSIIDASSPEEVIDIYQNYKDIGWGAQTQAANTLCEINDSVIIHAVGEEAKITICRIVK